MLTVTSPPLPAPKVLLEIWPPLVIDRLLPTIVTRPALPLADGKVDEKMPLGAVTPSITSRPSMEMLPLMATETSPALPGPNVLLEMPPTWVNDNEPADTVTWPASPVLPGLASAAIPAASKLTTPPTDNAPATSTRTLPALPAPPVL